MNVIFNTLNIIKDKNYKKKTFYISQDLVSLENIIYIKYLKEIREFYKKNEELSIAIDLCVEILYQNGSKYKAILATSVSYEECCHDAISLCFSENIKDIFVKSKENCFDFGEKQIKFIQQIQQKLKQTKTRG